MTSRTFSLRGRLGLDSRDFVRGAEEGGKVIDDLADKMEDLGDEAEDAGAEAGDSLGSAMIAGFTAVGAGAAITKLIDLGLEGLDLDAKFRAQFDLIGEDADRLGKVASGLYADAWGDSMEDVNLAVGTVHQTLVETRQISERETEAIAQGALAIAETWGEDVDAVIRSAGQLLKNDLAPTAEDALDVVTAGFQNGLNTAGDWLDSIDEYSQHFAAVGLSAEDMFTVFRSGFENGQRDADKVADAIKEMRIRAVEETDTLTAAYSSLGLSATATRDKFLEGGDAARDAYLEVLTAIKSVEDPVEQNRLAVELIGTQYEDLGPTAIDTLLSIQDATVDTTDATEDLIDTLDNEGREFERNKRKAKEMAVGLGELALNTLFHAQEVATFGTSAENGYDKAREALETFNGTAEEFREAMEDAGVATADVDLALDVAGGTLRDTWFSTRTLGSAVRDMTLDLLGNAEAAKDVTVDLGGLEQAHLDFAANGVPAIDSVGSAWDRLREDINLEKEILRAEESFKRTMESMRAEGSASRLNVLDLKSAVNDFALAAENVPDEAITEVQALIDEGSFRVAQARLAVLTARETKVIDIYVPGVTPIPTPASTAPSGIPSNIEHLRGPVAPALGRSAPAPAVPALAASGGVATSSASLTINYPNREPDPVNDIADGFRMAATQYGAFVT